MDTTNLSNDELNALIIRRYREACESGFIKKVHAIAKNLGENLYSKYGPKYKWSKNGVEIYVDDYGHFLTVSENKKNVLSTHPNDQFIIPGDWMTLVEQCYPYTIKKISDQERLRIEAERQQLLKKLI